MQQHPSLLITDPSKFKRPRLPRASDPEITLWCDRQGAIGGLSHLVNDEHWLHVLGVASYRLEITENAVSAIPWENSTQESIFDAFQSTVWPTFLQIQGREVLHASAVVGKRGVVAFCAPSETGKSTLAYALGRRGYSVWADDAVVLDVLPHSALTHSLPFFTRLRSASALHFGYLENQVYAGRVRCEGRQSTESLPLATICLLDQAQTLPDNQAVTMCRLNAAEALVRVLDHALYFSLQDRARKRRMVEQYLALVGRVPVFNVTLRQGLERLPTILEQLEQRILAPVAE